MGPNLQGKDSRPFLLRDLLARSSHIELDAPVLLAPERQPLSYARLLQLVHETESALRNNGITRQHRVALVLPNGPELAACLIAVASNAVCVPLNPTYLADEFELYLSRLRVDALIVEFGSRSPALAVAKSRGIRILELVAQVLQPAGVFFLQTAPGQDPASGREADSGDVALLLHTSGTNGRPKVVPFTHGNLAHSAENIRASLALTAGDRCLNVMPMSHSHGILTGMMASIAAGASIVCAPGFYAARFFHWLESFRPTWYTAVPAMHLSILARAPQHRDIIAGCPLRFIRSGSAPLSPRTMNALENTFSAPVIEAYATTETSQICSNPLPPRVRKTGSVGIPTGTQVAILGDGQPPAPGIAGNIAVRGANVMAGYEEGEEENQNAFRDGWFFTGDRGYLDEDGYLFISGTAKEMINRGGEKISPREVDEALMSHPAVTQAVTFAVPDSRLGEEVAAAVVVSQAVSESVLIEHVNQKLADFKVPRRIVFVQEIPRNATGKPQRLGLATRFDMQRISQEGTEPGAQVGPRNPIETQLCAIWAEILGVHDLGVHDNFFQRGGDSLTAAAMLARVAAQFHTELTLSSVFVNPTIALLAGAISGQQRELDLNSAEVFG